MKYLRPVLIVMLLAFIILFWSILPIGMWVEQFRQWVVALGFLGVVFYVGLYSVFALILAPVSLLSLAAGLAYGAWGFPLVLFSATLAATLSFLVGRYLGWQRVSRWLEKDSRLNAFNAAVSEGGWRVVGLIRLSPLIPFGIQNYFFALTDIKLHAYVLASAVGMIPGTLLYVYIGAIGQSIGQGGVLQWALIIFGLLCTVFVAWFVARRANEILSSTHADSSTSH